MLRLSLFEMRSGTPSGLVPFLVQVSSIQIQASSPEKFATSP